MNTVNFVLGIVVAIVGVIMTVTPGSLLQIIVILMGAGSLVFGIFDIVKVRILTADQKYRTSVLVRGLVSIVIGVIAVIWPLAAGEALVKVVNILLYVLGAFLIICAVEDIFIIMKLHQYDVDAKGVVGKCISTLAVGVLLCFLPVESLMKFILRVIGVILILGGLGFSFATWRKRITVIQPDEVRDATGGESGSTYSGETTVVEAGNDSDDAEDAIVVEVENSDE